MLKELGFGSQPAAGPGELKEAEVKYHSSLIPSVKEMYMGDNLYLRCAMIRKNKGYVPIRNW